MKHYHSSYCFEMGLGGINVKNDKPTASEYIRFFLEDANRPAVVMKLDGMVCQTNGQFKKLFDMGESWNIRELFDCDSTRIWDDFFNIVAKKSRTFFARRVIFASDSAGSIKVRLMYCPEERKVIALFTFPKSVQKEAEVTYLKAYRKSDNFMVLIDMNGVICDMNELSQEFINIPREDLIGKKGEDLIALFISSEKGVSNYINRVVKEGRAEMTRRFERTPGDIRYYHITSFFDEETQMYLTRMTDRTAKAVLEERLAHADSLSSVGQLAASIAHEIRNPMTTLKGFIQLLKVTSPEDSQEYLTVIDEEIIRMESILSEMLILSKPSTSEKEILSLQDVVSDISQVIYPKARLENIIIVHRNLTISDEFIYGDAGKLKQVLLNIFKNSLEAMTDGGTLTIEIENEGDSSIKLSITDTGEGMHTSQINNIFTPFFTMKETGTGLGLPFVMKTIKDHDGTIKVESEVGVGTKFTLTFPSAVTYMPFESVDGLALSESGRLA